MTAVFAPRTWRAMKLDLYRLRCRLTSFLQSVPANAEQLHLGCGSRLVPGFLNCDLSGSEHDLDLGAGSLPWRTASFKAVVCQHVVEHLDVKDQMPEFLQEVHRILKPDGEFWLSTPDMASICKAYVAGQGCELLRDRCSRWPAFTLGGLPTPHILNALFHQEGEHLNLFDFELLHAVLGKAGFRTAERTSETELLARFKGFPYRNDDAFSLYIRARP